MGSALKLISFLRNVKEKTFKIRTGNVLLKILPNTILITAILANRFFQLALLLNGERFITEKIG